ncbi:hypothetical protein B0H17DRAFT_1052618 [Mycena rosella]|uniref:Uncharacterized protein n=1 Tax=Mycena rosella TaxID=1033263 RepID=A0AAD7DQT4_MYCRO|nr:hypothetical protein B0H17DRAFT_1052618 [Mycena rosella]
MLGPSLHILFLYILNTLAAGAHAALKRRNARFRDHGDERRRSIASVFAIITGKTALFVLAFPVLRAIVLAHETWSPALVACAHLCAQVLMVTYLFDMTYRHVNAILWVHHTLTLSACLFFLHVTGPSAPGPARLWLTVPMLFLGLGVGLTDLGGDVAVLTYYLAPPSAGAAYVIRMCARYLMLGRATQWVLVLSVLFRGEWHALGLGNAAVGIMGVVLLTWGAAELEEIYAILGMSQKLRLRTLANAGRTENGAEPKS